MASERSRQHESENLRGAARLTFTLKESVQIFLIVVVTGINIFQLYLDSFNRLILI
jgi:hypothetical protein